MAALAPATAATPPDDRPDADRRGVGALLVGALAALAASTCCVMPLVFVLVGISGAWIGGLTAMSPWTWAFEALAVAALGVAGWRLYGPVPTAASGTSVCTADGTTATAPAACPARSPIARAAFWVVAVLVLVPIVVPLLAPWFY